ncbi:Aldo/keto reductase [Cylindrobasidium torrendii FP15055 ss-10]|uniref:Aldo/keto reductase n=1 Tax=Cylindrobasidium torrendii FP15055 ss-10 TaxID=1314674 RepID=A0A0D7BMB2_9AGAR|nr:Aldo/keto reductase [Cylindrobasidium torrendii FP15055 ss-10]
MATSTTPASKLGVYRLLSPQASVHVSPICLGGLSIGDKWNGRLGEMTKESSFALLDAYFDLGGNFIDTANSYQDGTSEEFIGEWMESRGIRDQVVLATKYTSGSTIDPSIKTRVNYTGNGTKSLRLSVESSLKRLRTTYIDLLYLHWWDYETSIREIMDSLHALVVAGKVNYLGISDTPAWVVSQANQYALDHGKTPFSVYQGRWSVLDRDFEREIIPMARAHGMALVPWAVLGGGKLRTDEEEKQREASGEQQRVFYGPEWKRNEKEREVSRALEKVAQDIGAKSIAAVAIAYVMQKTPYVFPVIGGRKIDQLKSNIEALEISLSKEHIAFIEDAAPTDFGFLPGFIGTGSTYAMLFQPAGELARQPFAEPIKP